MSRWWLAARIAVVGLVFGSYSATVMAADPLVLLLLRMMRDQTISTAIESGVTASQQASKPESDIAARAAPQPFSEGQWLKSLIDESFVHLGPQQREELHASLVRILSDPKNDAARSAILAEFTAQAIAVRDAHRQLSRLTEADMKLIAAEARLEFEKLPQEQRRQLLQALQQGVPGMPQALHDLMLAEFASVTSSR